MNIANLNMHLHGVDIDLDCYNQRCLLNKDFEENAKIKGLVSYIYYPKQSSQCLGHAKLEMEGHSSNWDSGSYFYLKSLESAIEYSQSGKGYPFFRFNISVTPKQLTLLRENFDKCLGYSCSQQALFSLSRYCDYSIPLVFTIFPLIATCYLRVAKALNSKRITKIEFFGSQDSRVNLAKCLQGVLGETALYGMMFFVACLVCNVAFKIL